MKLINCTRIQPGRASNVVKRIWHETLTINLEVGDVTRVTVSFY